MRRTWHAHAVVGLVGPNDVVDIQRRVDDYRGAIQAAVDGLATAGTPLSHDSGRWSIQAWADVSGRATAFVGESHSVVNPGTYLFAGGDYERGRQLIIELDAWRDELAKRNAPNLPAPAPVPNSDVDILGKVGEIAEGLIVLAGLYLVAKVVHDWRH